ncbi:MAG: hypothetical protein WBQ17_08945 [Rhizomicrobium sp.]
MAEASALTAIALNALFGLCVPSVSQGKLEQTFPTADILPLTDKERAAYADAIKDDDRSFRARSSSGFVLVTIKGGFCRVIIGEDEGQKAADDFLAKLKIAGGHEDRVSKGKEGYETIDGTIPLDGGDIVALVFTTRLNSNSGFFASAFGAHKD